MEGWLLAILVVGLLLLPFYVYMVSKSAMLGKLMALKLFEKKNKEEDADGQKKKEDEQVPR